MSDQTEYKLKEEELPPSEEKRPCLIMIRGDFIGQVYELQKDVTMIGRSDEQDLIISDPSISRRHSMIVKRVGGFYISDLGSTNNTKVNKNIVTEATPIHEGDKLDLGEITFKFSFQDQDDTAYHTLLRNMAIKDGLTRIYNKRYLIEVLDKEFDYSRRSSEPLALIIFDIDFFKQLNDTYGHPAGDLVLKNLASTIDDLNRDYDVFARFGGEEFVFLLRGVEMEGAAIVAERVRKLVEECVFEYEEVELKITISLGIAVYAGDDSLENPTELIEAADKQLYRAKDSGRNQVKYEGC